MTHEDLIQRLAQQLGWSDETATDALDAMIAMLKAELTANNPVDLDDFGRFSTPKQPEYILTDRETNDRYLMPPAVEVLFESSADLFFTPEDSLNESVNSAFSFFEPTPLNEGVALPGVPEVIVGGEEETEEEAVSETTEAEKETEGTETQTGETAETEKDEKIEAEKDGKIEVETEKTETEKTEAERTEAETAEAGKVAVETEQEKVETEKDAEETTKATEKKSDEIAPEVKLVRDHGPYRRKARHRKKSPLWIPIAGGVAIALAALFFFREWQPEKNKSVVTLQQWPEVEVKTNMPPQEFKTDIPIPEAKKVRLANGKTLRLLAQDLFGDREFWVYIYLENKSQINNPNSVPAGTELIVPDRIKYGINAADPGSVARAKNQGNKILGIPGN